MSNFKVGDAVVAVREFPGQLTRGKEYTILSISYDGWHRVCTDNGTVDGFTANAFKLATDDPLPPVPDSVMYFNSVRDEDNDQRLVVEMTSESDMWNDEANAHVGLMVIPRTGSTRASKGIGINLSPDAALQLAHDLNRMAMDIRRKEKASEV